MWAGLDGVIKGAAGLDELMEWLGFATGCYGLINGCGLGMVEGWID
jgi:hypothetical protein